MVNSYQLDRWALEDAKTDTMKNFLWDDRTNRACAFRMKYLNSESRNEYMALYTKAQLLEKKALTKRCMRFAETDINRRTASELETLGDDLAKDGWRPFAKILWRHAKKVRRG